MAGPITCSSWLRIDPAGARIARAGRSGVPHRVHAPDDSAVRCGRRPIDGRADTREHRGGVPGYFSYVDVNVPVLTRVHERRIKGYRIMGYAVQSNSS